MWIGKYYGSTYLINQREEAIKNKWDKYEKEKEERKDDEVSSQTVDSLVYILSSPAGACF